MAIKVKLREKEISGDRLSCYLDFYPEIPNPITGKPTRREFLKMYLFKNAKNPIEKQHNKETKQIAEQIRQKRENHLNKPEIYTGYEKEQLRIKELGEQNFVAYFKSLADKRKASNYDNWVSAYKYLETFTGGNLKFADLNEKFCDEFKGYLLTTKSNKNKKVTLSQNSAGSYFNKMKATLKQAYNDGYLPNDLNSKIKPIKEQETQREFLTIEEVNRLLKTECKNPLLKTATIFSALTGLRHSDIKKLIWGELEYIEGNGYFIKFQQEKTKSFEMHPISNQAFSLLGERKEPKDKVFEGLIYSDHENEKLKEWIKDAGITKKITFHNFRHTYATLQLSSGTDIFTISKMLGHKNLKTTQIYAKVINQAKRDTTDKIQLDF
jgi:integrase